MSMTKEEICDQMVRHVLPGRGRCAGRRAKRCDVTGKGRRR